MDALTSAAPVEPGSADGSLRPADKREAAAIRGLIRLLLATHSQKDVLAMMQCTVSGREVTLGTVRRQRRNMIADGAPLRRTNASRKHLRDAPPSDAMVHHPAPVSALPAPVAPRRSATIPETFESQMARIAADARLMPAPDFRTTGPSYTLGGVASGML